MSTLARIGVLAGTASNSFWIGKLLSCVNTVNTVDADGNVTVLGTQSGNVVGYRLQTTGSLIDSVNLDNSDVDNNYQVTDTKVTNTGNIYVTVMWTDVNNYQQFAVIKFDSLWNIVWQKKTDNSFDSSAQAITIDNDENVYVVGKYDTKFYAMKLDATDGSVLWNKGLSVANGEFNNMFATANGFFVVGELGDNQENSIVLQFNNDGTLSSFKKQINVPSSIQTIATSVAQDNNGNVYVAGTRDGVSSSFVIKFASNGSLIWQKKLNNGFYNPRIVLDTSSNLYVTGEDGNNSKQYIFKYGSSGAFVWGRTLAKTGSIDGVKSKPFITANALHISNYFQSKFSLTGSGLGTYTVNGSTVTYANASQNDTTGDCVITTPFISIDNVVTVSLTDANISISSGSLLWDSASI